MRCDPEVIVKQVRGDYRVKQPESRPLRNRAQELANEVEQFEIQHISREENWKADELVDREFDNCVGPMSVKVLSRNILWKTHPTVLSCGHCQQPSIRAQWSVSIFTERDSYLGNNLVCLAPLTLGCMEW